MPDIAKKPRHNHPRASDPLAKYSLSDLEKYTGAPFRSLQFWAEQGALIPSAETQYGGRGRHRLFTLTELRVAALLKPFHRLGLPIGHLVGTAKMFRAALEGKPHLSELGRVLRRAGRGEGANWMSFLVTPFNFTSRLATDEDGREATLVFPNPDPPAIDDQDLTIVSFNLTARLAGLPED